VGTPKNSEQREKYEEEKRHRLDDYGGKRVSRREVRYFYVEFLRKAVVYSGDPPHSNPNLVSGTSVQNIANPLALKFVMHSVSPLLSLKNNIMKSITSSPATAVQPWTSTP
jgi:hypothetical protein